jgi:hypothetical protein
LNLSPFLPQDGLLPFLSPKRFPWIATPKNIFQRRWSVLFACALMQGVVFVGSPNVVAPLLSLAYLFFTR